MKRFTDEAVSQPAMVRTGCLYSHLIESDDATDDVPETEDDPCWNVTSLEARAAQSAEDRD